MYLQLADFSVFSFSFLFVHPGMSDLAHSCSSCFKVKMRVEGQGGIKSVFAIVILYFELCVQILVPLSGLNDGSNNICPLRQKFHMLFVTIGVGNLE